MARFRSAVVVASVLALTVSACSSGGSKTATKRHTTTTTRRRRHPSTTSSSSTSSTSSLPTSSSTTAPPSSSTTAPAGSDSCGARSAPIYAAVQGGDLGPVPLASYTLGNCRISPTTPIWSAVTLVPNAGTGVPQLTVVLQRVGSIWTVHAYGQSRVGCDAPPPVPTELRLGC